jgi:hypothetical protein
MAMNKARRTANLNNILTYDTLGNSTLVANLTVEGLTGAGFVKADANGLLSVDTAAYTVVTGATNYLTKITAPNTLGQSLVYDNGTSVLVNTIVGVPGYSHAFQVVANAAGGLVVSTTNTASAIGIVNSASGNKTWDISPFNNTLVINESGVATSMVFHPGGNITIGDITTTGHKLEVVGSFRTTGNNTLSQLQGVGTRMVVVDTNGLLSTQAIATGSVTGSGAAGQVAYWDGTTSQAGSNNLFWDNTNGSLGIGTATPSGIWSGNNRSIQILAPANFASELVLSRPAGSFGAASVTHFLSGGGVDLFGIYTASTTSSYVVYTNNNERLRIWTTGNVSIGAGNNPSDSGQRLQVTGDTLLKGSGATSATFGLTVQDSGATNSFRVRNDGQVQVRSTNVGNPGYSFFDSTNTGLYLVGGTLATSVNGAYTILYQSLGTQLYSNGSNAVATPNLLLAKSGVNHRLSVWINPSNDFQFEAWESGVGYANNLILNAIGGNVLIGSTTNSGERLQVTGTMKVTGLIYGESGIVVGASASGGIVRASATNAANLRFTIGGSSLLGAYGAGIANSAFLFSYPNSNNTDAATHSLWGIAHTFNPTSGTTGYIMAGLQPTINQTGGANGITRGLYVNPTLTAAADWRAIEVSAGVSVLAPSTTTSASLRIPSGTAPTTPNEGDIWATTTDLVARVNGVSYSLINSGLTGSGVASQLTYWSSASGITGNNFATTNNSTIILNRPDDNYGTPYLQLTNGNANLRFFLGGDQARISISNRLNFDADAGMLTNKRLYISNLGINTPNSRIAILVTENNDVTGTRTSAVTLGESLGNSIASTSILGVNTSWRTGLTVNSQARLDGQSTALGMIGSLFSQAITAPANNSFLAGVVVRPSFTNGAFTGVTNVALGIENSSGYSLYQIGTAVNYLASRLLIGSTTDTTEAIQVTGTAKITGATTITNQITAGNAQATAGSVVLRSTYSSGNISNIGTNGSSGGMSINYAAYPASTSTADAYLSGVGTLSFPRSSYIVQADHRWLSAADAIVAEGSAVALTEKMRLYNSGNLVIQNGGTYADAGQRLQVQGDVFIKGSGNTGSSTAFAVQNSDGTYLLLVNNSGYYKLSGANGLFISMFTTTGGAASISGTNTQFYNYTTTQAATFGAFLFTGDNFSHTSGFNHTVFITKGFVATSGTGSFSNLTIQTSTINQTGGANGVTRGLYINPTLTAAADWRSIEWSNNSGWGLYGAGTASNYLGGSLGIAITPTSRLHVAGSGNTATTNSFIAQNSSASVALRVADNGDVYLGDGEWLKVQGFAKRYIYKGDATNGIFSISSCSSLGTTFNMYGATHASKPKTIEIGASYAPNSGTIAYNALEIASNIDQTGTANAITRGLYVNPVLNNTVSRNNWRSIAWSNNEGYGLFGIGTAQNLLSGKLTVNVSVASANLSNSENTISLFGAQTLNIPAATIGTPGVVYAAGTSANYMRFNGNTTMNGDALFAGKAVINSLQFDTTGTVTMSNGGAGGGRALSGLQVQMQFAGATSGTVTKGASILIQGVYPNNTAGTVTFTEYYGLRINDLLEWDTGTGAGKIAMTNKWAIFQSGANDRNHFNGAVLIGTSTVGGSKLKVSGLPTSATGLTAGDIWNNAGVLNIV